MNIFTRAWNGIFGRTKWATYPTIVGGTEIFRNMPWVDSWSDGKRMGAYTKSLYVYACVSKIAQKTASIDWGLFKIKNSQGDKKEIFVHEALDLLYRPNPFQTKGEFFERYMINKKLTGSAFILKVRNGSGKVVEMWNLRPDYMRILLDKEDIIKGYEFMGGGETIIFAPEDIIHDSYPDPLSDFGGVSPLQPAQSRVDVEDFSQKYQKHFFQNNARPDFLLLSDKKISAEQKEDMRESWDKRHRAGDDQKRVGKGAFLEGGLKYQQVSISQREMDYIETLKLTRDDILVAFAVPKPIVAITDDVNLANAKTAMEIFISETIVPEIKQLTEKLNEHLIYPEFGDNMFIEFVSPVEDNKKELAEIQALRLQNGTMLINEAREQWGDQPVKGGNTLYMPFGMTPVGGLPAAGEEKSKLVAVLGSEKGSPYTEKKREEKRHVFKGRRRAYKFVKLVETIEKEIMREALAESLKDDDEAETETGPKITKFIKDGIRKDYGDLIVKSIDERGDAFKPAVNAFAEKQQKRLMKALGSVLKGMEKVKAGDIESKLEKWAEAESVLAAEFSIPYIGEFVKQAGETAMEQVAPAETFDEKNKRVVEFIKKRAKQFGKETTMTTYDKLGKTLAEGIAADEGVRELVERIDNVYADFPLYRSEAIARTEATAANNKGFTEAYRQSGVANGKEWIATGDGRTRDSHADVDGTVVGLDEEFRNGLEYPGDASGGPEETVNCRCVLGPAFIEE